MTLEKNINFIFYQGKKWPWEQSPDPAMVVWVRTGAELQAVIASTKQYFQHIEFLNIWTPATANTSKHTARMLRS